MDWWLPGESLERRWDELQHNGRSLAGFHEEARRRECVWSGGWKMRSAIGHKPQCAGDMDATPKCDDRHETNHEHLLRFDRTRKAFLPHIAAWLTDSNVGVGNRNEWKRLHPSYFGIYLIKQSLP